MDTGDRVQGKDQGMTASASSLKVKIFADGADRKAILDLYANPLIKGFTTNPTLMRQAGVKDYEAFARELLAEIKDRPFSLEVFSDEFAEMERQAMKLAALGDNVYVKIPVSNTRRESAAPLIHRLARRGVKVNATALLTLAQVREIRDQLAGGPPSIISVFAGRVADTGVDPVPLMRSALRRWRRTGTSRSSGRARGRSSTSFRRIRSAVTSSPSPPIS
jgi:transaldolase